MYMHIHYYAPEREGIRGCLISTAACPRPTFTLSGPPAEPFLVGPISINIKTANSHVYIYIWRRAINPIHGSSRKNKSYGGGKIGFLHSEKLVSHPEKAGTAVGGVIAFVAGARPTKDLADVAAPVGISVGMPGPRLRDGAFKIAFSVFGKGLPSPTKTILDLFDSSLLRLVRTFCSMCFWWPKC